MDFSLSDQLKASLGSYLPLLLGAIAILLIGLILALLVKAGIRKAFSLLRVDERLNRQTDSPLPVTSIAANTGFWFVILLTLLAMFSTLRFDALYLPFANLAGAVLIYLPRIFLACILALIAWVLAIVLKLGINRLTAATQLDEKLSESAGVKPIGSVLGNVVFWLVLLLFLPAIVSALQIEGLTTPLTDLTQRITGALPDIFAAAIIGFAGWLLAKVARGLTVNLLAAGGVEGFGRRLGLPNEVSIPRLVGTLVFALIIVPTVIAALDALNIAAISDPAVSMLAQFMAAVPNIFAAALILLLAWLVGRMVSNLIRRVLENFGFDQLLARLGLRALANTGSPAVKALEAPRPEANLNSENSPEPNAHVLIVHTPASAAVETTEPRFKPSELVGRIAWFFIMLFATVEAANRLEFSGLRDLLVVFIDFGSDVLLGSVILIVGYWLADFVARAIARANPDGGPMLSRIARFAILALVLAMGLRAMGIASDIINLGFGLILGAVAVAVALAFGLGGREAAGKLANRWVSDYLNRKKD